MQEPILESAIRTGASSVGSETATVCLIAPAVFHPLPILSRSATVALRSSQFRCSLPDPQNDELFRSFSDLLDPRLSSASEGLSPWIAALSVQSRFPWGARRVRGPVCDLTIIGHLPSQFPLSLSTGKKAARNCTIFSHRKREDLLAATVKVKRFDHRTSSFFGIFHCP